MTDEKRQEYPLNPGEYVRYTANYPWLGPICTVQSIDHNRGLINVLHQNGCVKAVRRDVIERVEVTK